MRRLTISGALSSRAPDADLLVGPGVAGLDGEYYASGTSSLVKVLRQRGVHVEYATPAPRLELSLKSNEIWLPALFVFSEVAKVVAAALIAEGVRRLVADDDGDKQVHVRVARLDADRVHYRGLELHGPARDVTPIIERLVNSNEPDVPED